MDINRFDKKNKIEALGFITMFILMLYKGLSLKFYITPVISVPFTFNYTYFKILTLFMFIAIISSSLYYCSANISKKNKSLEYIGGSTLINLGVLIISIVLSFIGTNIFLNFTDISQSVLSSSILIQKLDSIIISLESLWITIALSFLAIKEYKNSFILVLINLIAGVIIYSIFAFTNIFTGNFAFYGSLLALILSATLSMIISLGMLYNQFKKNSLNIFKTSSKVYFNIIRIGKWSILSSFMTTAILMLFINGIVTNDIHQEIFSLYATLGYIFFLVISTPIYASSIILGISLNCKYKNIDFKAIRKALTKFVFGITIYLAITISIFRIFAIPILSYFNLEINSEILSVNFNHIFLITIICTFALALSTSIKGYFLGIGKVKRLFISKVLLSLITIVPVAILQYFNIFRFNGDSIFIYIAFYLLIDLLISFVSYSKVMNNLEVSEITIMFSKFNNSSKNTSVG